MAATTNDLHEKLQAFTQRASEAEVRLERLESMLVKKEDEKGFDTGNLELKKLVQGLQSKLVSVQAEAAIEKEKARKEADKHEAENAKLKYRIIHLLQALTQAEG